MNNRFPRILFITPCAFNRVTGGGITFSNLFSGWPKDSLATITDDIVPVSTDVCSRYYFLSFKERPYVWPFSYFYKRKCTADFYRKETRMISNNKEKKGLLRAAKYILGSAGLPDRGILSQELYLWIKEFNPQVIYTILGSVGYIELIEKIRLKFNLPLIVHFMDEGVTNPQSDGLFKNYIRKSTSKKIHFLLNQAVYRIAICDEMAKAYQARYGYAFEVFQNTVDIQRWSYYAKKDISILDRIKLLYAGSIFSFSQLESLNDGCKAVIELTDDGINISFDIYTPLNICKDYLTLTQLYKASDCIRFYDAVSNDKDFFRILGEVDILLLPANFSRESRHFLRYSMPTKIPAYLSSGTPILVYGPSDIAQVKYALGDKWGYVVPSPGVQYVKQGIMDLVKDRGLRSTLSVQAKCVASQNHDSSMVRKKFQELLINCAKIN